MTKFILAVALAALAASSTYAAEPGAVAFSQNVLQTEECEQGTCSLSAKGILNFAQTITLTPQEETGLNEDTSVTVSIEGFVVQVRLGDDPSFENGDTSAKVSVVVPIIGDITDTAIVQLKWGNGEMKIKFALRIDGETNDVPELLKNFKDTKDINTLFVIVAADNGAINVFTASTEVPFDAKSSGVATARAEGDEIFKFRTTAKSKVLPPV